jgi:hypothetical protein
VALTPTTLGPSLGESGDVMPAQILDGGQGGGLDAGVTAGSLTALHGDAIALGRRRAGAAHAHVGSRVAVMLGGGTRTHATVVAVYTRQLAFGDALLAPELAAGHQTNPLLGTILVDATVPAIVAQPLQALSPRYPGLRVSDRSSFATANDADREMNRWLGPRFVAMIFAFTSIAVINTLTMIALRRRRELALLRLVGATARQVWSMARWAAGLIVMIGLGLGLAIAAHGAAPSQPRADWQPAALRPGRPAGGDPWHVGPAGAAGPGLADPTGARGAAGRGDRSRRIAHPEGTDRSDARPGRRGLPAPRRPRLTQADCEGGRPR